MTDLPPWDRDSEIRARWGALKSSTRVWDYPRAVTEFGRGVLHPKLVKELYWLSSEVLIAQAAKYISCQLVTIMDHRATNFQQVIEELKSGGNLELVAVTEQRAVTAEQWATDVHTENKKLLAQLVEVTQWLELLDKELNDTQADLSDAQRQLNN
ncbi:hypothetical protein B296_00012712 [Ensete ventricosum]|uniref:Uncharacterized protein n=1 Tax=Ensete ventricosum TaxID=4639 RepID=A0A426YH24_ENSVE|nr:hypothetical protein B296_00012712 [Ensete ventricosum]